MGVSLGRMSPKPCPEGLVPASSTPIPSSPPTPAFQNLTRLKRLNLDGNSLSTVPALPASLQELKLNDNLLQGLQRSSFRGVGGPGGGQGPEGLSSPGDRGKVWARGGLPRAAWLDGREGSASLGKWLWLLGPGGLWSYHGQLTCPSVTTCRARTAADAGGGREPAA